jgi:hypothetical protein
MKELVEDDLMGYEPNTKVLHARLDRIGSVSLGDRYRVPKQYIHSGIGEVTQIDKFNVTLDGETESFWVIDLKAAIAEPVDPCDSDFMEENSS